MKSPKWILGAGWFAFLLYAYPGYLQSDSANQLIDARAGELTDWQAPMMTQIWRMAGWVIAGPAGMLLLQSGLLLAGMYLLARRFVSARAAAITASGVLVFPPTMAITAVIMPEALLPGLMLCGAAGLVAERMGIRLLGLGLIAIACGMHDGARYAALPIIVALFVWRDHHSRERRLALAVAAWLACIVVAGGVTWVLVDLETHRAEILLARGDVSGALSQAPALPDREIRELLDGVPLAGSTDLQQRARASQLIVEPSTDAEQEALFAARRTVMRAHPGAYLQHRSRMFLRALGVTKQVAAVYTQFVGYPEHATRLQHLERHSLVQRTLIAGVSWLARTPLFRPYLYLALAFVVLALPLARQRRLPAVLVVSGILYEMTLLFSASRADYRDSHWLVVATTAAIGLVIAAVLEARHERIAE